MYEARRLEHGLTGVQARVLRPDGTIDGPYTLTELPAPFWGRYVYDYSNTMSYPEGDYFAFVSSPMDETFTTYRFELFKPWLTSVSPTGNVTGGVEVVAPTQIDLPVVGTKDYQIFALITAPVGTLQDPDAGVDISIKDNVNNVVVPLTPMNRVQAGIYLFTYTVTAFDQLRPLNIRADCTVNGTAFANYRTTEVFSPVQTNAHYVPNLSLAIDPGHDQAEFLAWLTMDGGEVTDPTSAHLQIFDGQDVLVADLGVDSTPTTHGVFRFVMSPIAGVLVPGKAYTARVVIVRATIPYTTLVPFTMAAQVSTSTGECRSCDDNANAGAPVCQEAADVDLGLPQVYGTYSVFGGTIDQAIGEI
jgi:hypothetical protein